MDYSQPKPIGTVSIEENGNISTEKPWEPVTTPVVPYSTLSRPNGFLFAHGSACTSLATTSIEGHTYVSDVHIFRQDGNSVDVDRYIGSITPTNTLVILKISSSQILHHHLGIKDPIINNLPADKQRQVLNILGTRETS